MAANRVDQSPGTRFSTVYNFNKNMKAARDLVKEIEVRQPGLVDFIEQSGTGDSSVVIGLLASHAGARKRR
jgi:hypothetical protein